MSTTMNHQSRLLLALSIAALAACAGQEAGDGGNVSFGGAQDIGQFRDVLDRGEIPGPNTLDANGFMNEHFVELPEPDCGQLLCGHAMVSIGSDWVQGSDQVTLQVAMNSPISPDNLERKPLNLAVVVDTSGSMQGARIDYAKEGLHRLVDGLEEGDRLSLIEYNTDVRVLAPLGADADRDALHALVEGLVATGSTNIYGGLEAGFANVAQFYDPTRQNRVIFISDGQATAGITDDDLILEMAARRISAGIGVTTIGVGTSFNVELMRGLSEVGAGNFYFLEDAAAIAEVFTEELDYFVEPLAFDLSIEVSAGPDVSLGRAVGARGFESSSVRGELSLPAVFLASRTSATPNPNGRRGGGSTLFIELYPRVPLAELDASVLARVRLSYRLPGSEERYELNLDAAAPQPPTSEEAAFSHAAMASGYAVYNVYRGLETATEEASWGDYNCALSTVERTSSSTRRWTARDENTDLIADIELLEQFAQNLRNSGADGQWCNDYYGDEGDDVVMACTVSHRRGGSTAALFGLMLLAAAVRLRRRRG